ncbi:hypothetical protein HMPREF9525_02490, partial [Enterococcus faecium TX0133a04]
ITEKQLIEHRLPRGHEKATLFRVLRKILFQNKEMQQNLCRILSP